MTGKLRYSLSFKPDSALIHIEEEGTRRILYLDTLLKLALQEDIAPIQKLTKIHTRFFRNTDTLSFQKIEVDLSEMKEILFLLGKTNRLFYDKKPLRIQESKGTVCWRVEGSLWTGYIQFETQQILFAECDRIFPSWGLWQHTLFQIEPTISWRWVEKFLKGPIALDKTQEARFLEEGPKVVRAEENKTPELFLTDITGCFAKLPDHALPEWEKDLLEAGFVQKKTGFSDYFCQRETLFSTLSLLLDVGWNIFDRTKRKMVRHKETHWEIGEDRNTFVVQGKVLFTKGDVSIRPAMEAVAKGRLWVDVDAHHVGLLDSRQIESLPGNWTDEVMHLPKSSIGALFPLTSSDKVSWQTSLKEMALALKEGSFQQEVPLGSSFTGTLLEHQIQGVRWLYSLYKWGFSAFLADEMGLGKTVQILAFFSQLRTKLPILVVAPTSLLYHWASEIDRFLKDSRVYIHQGTDRKKDPLAFQHEQIVITSYALLRLDQALLSQISWEVIVLDESGAIKTAATQTAKTACLLQGRFRICLNGTPMENRPDELFSQFRFLLPDLSVSERPEKVKPFLLRRKKDELDLPEKLEQVVYIEMTDSQKLLYDQQLQKMKTYIEKTVGQDIKTIRQVEILEGLLRLRQIALDPRLVGSSEAGAKMERLHLELEEIVSENRKVLVYSQFTSFLQHVQQTVSFPCFYIDGKVSSEDRLSQVARFQEANGAAVFLLSLKAGGVGFNLTAADYVLILDPWWNEAVENQAIDRAHRIGRKHTVIAKRYVAVGTIEEKMMELKRQKIKTIETLITPSEDLNWTAEDWLHLLS